MCAGTHPSAVGRPLLELEDLTPLHRDHSLEPEAELDCGFVEAAGDASTAVRGERDLDQTVGDIRAAKSDGALDAASLGLGQAARDRCVVNDAHSVEPNLPVRCGKVATASQPVRRTPPADGFGLLLHVGSGGEDDCDRSALRGRPAAGR